MNSADLVLNWDPELIVIHNRAIRQYDTTNSLSFTGGGDQLVDNKRRRSLPLYQSHHQNSLCECHATMTSPESRLKLGSVTWTAVTGRDP